MFVPIGNYSSLGMLGFVGVAGVVLLLPEEAELPSQSCWNATYYLETATVSSPVAQVLECQGNRGNAYANRCV